MPVFEQGYRKYVGPRSTKPRALAIAWENIRPRMRWWVWLLMFLLLFLPFAVYAVGIFIAAYGFGGHAAADATAAVPRTIAFQESSNPAVVMAAIRGESLALYWSLLDQFSWMSVIIPAVACAGLFAADRRTGALQIYFARPVSRLDYLAGKLLAGAFFVAMATTVPALLLWIEALAFGTVSGFTWKTWIAPLSIVGASFFYALWTMGLVLSLSSVMRRPAFAAIAAIFLHNVATALGKILSETFDDDAWSVLMPNRAVGTMTAPLFDVDLPSWMHVPSAFAIAVGVPLALLAFTWSRVRAVEVST
jgi:hypothetical protein